VTFCAVTFFRNRVSAAWLGRLVFWTPFVLALCVARQVTQSYLPKVLEPKESEQVKIREHVFFVFIILPVPIPQLSWHGWLGMFIGSKTRSM